MMLQARSEMPPAAAGPRLWAPGMSPQAADVGSARAQEIARRRQEMLGMLHDLPESEYELSLTDLVENSGAAAEGKEEPAPGRSASGRQQAAAAAAAPERPERRPSSRRRDSGGGSGYRSSSDGVLLNFYMPRSLTRSFTAPRPGRTPPSISGGGRPASVSSDCNKRERDADADTAVRCWPMPWDRRWRRSGRRDPGAPPGESTIRAASAAVIKAANHSAAPAKKI